MTFDEKKNNDMNYKCFIIMGNKSFEINNLVIKNIFFFKINKFHLFPDFFDGLTNETLITQYFKFYYEH